MVLSVMSGMCVVPVDFGRLTLWLFFWGSSGTWQNEPCVSLSLHPFLLLGDWLMFFSWPSSPPVILFSSLNQTVFPSWNTKKQLKKIKITLYYILEWISGKYIEMIYNTILKVKLHHFTGQSKLLSPMRVNLRHVPGIDCSIIDLSYGVKVMMLHEYT